MSLFVENTHASSVYKNKNITWSVNLTDNFVGVNKVYANITRPNSSVISVNFTNLFSTVWAYNFSDTSTIGDYNITVFADDNNNNTAVLNAWFEVFENKTLYGNISAFGVNPGVFNITFLTPETHQELQNILVDGTTSNIYTLQAHNRIVDIKIDMVYGDFEEKNTIYLEDANITNVSDSSPIIQINRINTTNTSFSDIGFGNDDDIKRSVGIVGFSANNYLPCNSIRLTFNYTPMVTVGASESNFRVYKTTETIIPGSDLIWSDWVELTGHETNMMGNTISINVTGFSSYMIAQSVSALGPPPSYDPTPPTGGGGGGGVSTPPSTCGNAICEFGENALNCPFDCSASEFRMSTTMANVRISPGENKTYDIILENNMNYNISVLLSALGDLSEFLFFEKTNVTIPHNNKSVVALTITIPGTTAPGTYTGSIIAAAGDSVDVLSTQVVVGLEGSTKLTLNVEPLSKTATLNDVAKFNILIYNIGYKKDIPVTIEYYIKSVKNEVVEYYETQEIKIKSTSNFVKKFYLNESEITAGEHYLETIITYGGGNIVKKSVSFNILNPFWTAERIRLVGFWLVILFVTVAAAYTLFWYEKQKKLKARYVFPTDFSKLPGKADDAFWLGNIADTKKRSFFDPKDLVTHALVAGSTGAGKSVAASIFAEEALKKKIPVIVFDPTSQWTGFVKPCRDKNLIVNYPEFGLTSDSPRQFNGLLFNVTTSNISIDLKKYMNPGEITVFNMARLESAEYDIAVQKIIQKIFEQSWEESPTLRLLVVFDEVHRLLDKYGGGKGGYVAMEKACREFRKWGIGLIMVSQVNADFKSAVQGNILTEVQLNTKNMEDITKAETKYGSDYARRITRQAIGVGMLQNPKYNDGKPWFVSFRPTLHDPHKITDEELVKYDEYARKLETIEARIADIKKRGTDTSDKDIELKLAKDKLKQGRFKMAEIYIDSLENWLEKNK